MVNWDRTGLMKGASRRKTRRPDIPSILNGKPVQALIIPRQQMSKW
jgi:hypothetical protein